MKKIFISVLLLAALPYFAKAQFDSCLPGWLYYKEIVIDNSNNPQDLEDFSFKFTVNTGTLVNEGKLQNDGADLRFVMPDCSLLHYYMDSTATSNDNVIWLKMPFLAASSQMTIRMYYANDEAGTFANGDSTFMFFDGFESTEINPDKWEAIGEYATFTQADGLLDYASTSSNPGPRFKFARTKQSWTDSVDMDFRIKIGTSETFGFSSADSLIERYYFRYQNGSFFNDTLNLIAILGDTISNGYAVETDYPLLNISKGALTDISIRPYIDENNKLIVSQFTNVETGQTNTTNKDIGPFEMSGFHFVVSTFSPNFHVLVDYFRVRKIIDMMPGASIGQEENNPATVGTDQILFEGQFDVSPNPANEVFIVSYDWEKPALLEFYSLTGQLIFKRNLPANQQTLQFDGKQLNPGTYILHLKDAITGQSLKSQKLIISR